MRPIITVVTGVANGTPVPMDHYQSPFNVGLGAVITGTATYSVQHTFDDVQDPSVTPTWFSHSTMTAVTTNADGNYAFPVRAIRLSVAASTGSVALTIIQAGMPGK